MMFKVKVKNVDKLRFIYLEGRIDLSNAGACEEALIKNMDGVTKLVLDLSGVTFIDSTGISGLVAAIKAAHNKSVRFEITQVPDGINQIFEIIGIYEVLNDFN